MLARLMQQPRQLRAVFVVGLIQRVEQQNVADVEDVRVHLGPVHVALIKFPVRAQIGEERALLADLVAHDRREGGDAVAHHAGGVDVGVFAEALEDEVALRVGAGLAHGVKRKRRIQLGQIHNDIADRAPDGTGDAVLNVHQLALLRPAGGGVEDVDEHVARNADALAHGIAPLLRNFE